MIISGVEEAGRGPVIGPMVMAICAIDEKDEDKLRQLGVKDSKLILPRKREQLFDQITKMCKTEIIILEPKDIDAALNDPEMNLNKLEAKTSAELINKLAKKTKIDKIILDCPSNNIEAYRNLVRKQLENKKIDLLAEHKADLNHIIVGAASILAKVTRDKLIEEIKQNVGQDIGSGYPSDPKTVSFLKENWNKYPEIFRETWSTYKKVAEAHKQKGLDEF